MSNYRLGQPPKKREPYHMTIRRKRTPIALRRLGVTPEELTEASPITSFLRRLCRYPGSGSSSNEFLPLKARQFLIDHLRWSEDPEAKAFLEAYRSRGIRESHRESIPIEAYCVKAGVSPNRILEIFTGTAVRMGAQLSTIIAMIHHPEILKKTVEFAKRPRGLADRMVLHRATGFLPSPKGCQTIVNVQQNTAVTRQDTAQLPPMDSMIRSISDRFSEKLIEGHVLPKED